MLENHFYEDPMEIVLEEEELKTSKSELPQLIVFNDEVNTFDWVIKCFMEILKHDDKQAEQLSLMIHFNGKATVKTAPFSELKPKKDALLDRGLSAVIERGR